MVVHRGGDGDDDDRCPAQLFRVIGKKGLAAGKLLAVHFPGGVMAPAQGVHTGAVDVKADDVEMPGQRHGKGQAHIAEPHNGDSGRPLPQCIERNHALSSFPFVTSAGT